MISILNLEFFLILSEELNFNIAAKKLHITQQTLSGHIRKLEIHFGTKLFKYGPPLEITPARSALNMKCTLLTGHPVRRVHFALYD